MIFFSSASVAKCCLLLLGAGLFPCLGCFQIVSALAGRFKCKQSLSRRESRYQIWATFKRCIGSKSEVGVKTCGVNPAKKFLSWRVEEFDLLLLLLSLLSSRSVLVVSVGFQPLNHTVKAGLKKKKATKTFFLVFPPFLFSELTLLFGCSGDN